MLDIMVVRITHVEWMHELEMMLEKSNTAINLRSCSECDLGIWLDGEARQVYKAIPEIKLLEISHEAFHVAADKVVAWHNHPGLSPQKMAQAQVDFDEALRMSKEIVYYLTMLEFKMLQRYQVRETSSSIVLKDVILHPMRALNSWMGNKPVSQDISKTSLNLLKKDLQKERVKAH